MHSNLVVLFYLTLAFFGVWAGFKSYALRKEAASNPAPALKKKIQRMNLLIRGAYVIMVVTTFVNYYYKK